MGQELLVGLRNALWEIIRAKQNIDRRDIIPPERATTPQINNVLDVPVGDSGGSILEGDEGTVQVLLPVVVEPPQQYIMPGSIEAPVPRTIKLNETILPPGVVPIQPIENSALNEPPEGVLWDLSTIPVEARWDLFQKVVDHNARIRTEAPPPIISSDPVRNPVTIDQNPTEIINVPAENVNITNDITPDGDPEMAQDWGDFATGLIQDNLTTYINNRVNRGNGGANVMPVISPGTGAAIGTGIGLGIDEVVDWATGTKKKCRRRRRRLLTPTDLGDLAQLKALVGNGEAMKIAVMKAIRR